MNTRGLFPAGEGCGDADGMLLAAVDGIKVAGAAAASLVEAAQGPGNRASAARASRAVLEQVAADRASTLSERPDPKPPFWGFTGLGKAILPAA